MDDHLFGQKQYNPGERHGLLDELRDTVTQQGGLLLVDVHDYVYDDTLFPGWAATYRALWEDLAARGRVWFATPAAIARHWITRANQLAAVSTGLNEEAMNQPLSLKTSSQPI
jgi:hypothetical protein